MADFVTKCCYLNLYVGQTVSRGTVITSAPLDNVSDFGVGVAAILVSSIRRCLIGLIHKAKIIILNKDLIGKWHGNASFVAVAMALFVSSTTIHRWWIKCLRVLSQEVEGGSGEHMLVCLMIHRPCHHRHRSLRLLPSSI